MSVCYCDDCECECKPTDEYSRWGLSHMWCSNYGCMVAMDKERICSECHECCPSCGSSLRNAEY
jgi:hypothetical protein